MRCRFEIAATNATSRADRFGAALRGPGGRATPRRIDLHVRLPAPPAKRLPRRLPHATAPRDCHATAPRDCNAACVFDAPRPLCHQGGAGRRAARARGPARSRASKHRPLHAPRRCGRRAPADVAAPLPREQVRGRGRDSPAQRRVDLTRSWTHSGSTKWAKCRPLFCDVSGPAEAGYAKESSTTRKLGNGYSPRAPETYHQHTRRAPEMCQSCPEIVEHVLLEPRCGQSSVLKWKNRTNVWTTSAKVGRKSKSWPKLAEVGPKWPKMAIC